MAYDSKWGNRLISDLQRDFGLSREAAQGFAGVLAMESKGFTDWQEDAPVVPGSRGGGGMAQWTGVRRREFEAWAKKNGYDGDKLMSYESQYGYLKKELTEGKHSGGVIKKLKGVTDPTTAGRLTTKHFLRPGKVNQKSRDNWVQEAVRQYKPTPGVGLGDENGARQLNADPMGGISKIASLVSGVTGGGIKFQPTGSLDSLMSYSDAPAVAKNNATRKPTGKVTEAPLPAIKTKAVQAKQDAVLNNIDTIFKMGLQLDDDSRRMGGVVGRQLAPAADLVLAGVDKTFGKPLIQPAVAKKELPKPAPLTFKPAAAKEPIRPSWTPKPAGKIVSPAQAGKVAMPADARPSSIPKVKPNPLLEEMFPDPQKGIKAPTMDETQSEQKLMRKSTLKLGPAAVETNPVIKMGENLLTVGETITGNQPVYGAVDPTKIPVIPATKSTMMKYATMTPARDVRHTGKVQADYGSKPGQSTAGLKPGQRQYNADTNSWDLKA